MTGLQKRKRAPGTGSIERLPSGKYRVRFVDATGVRRSLGELFDTREEAQAILDAAIATIRSGAVVCVSIETLAGFGERDLERREREGGGGMQALKSRWTTWVVEAPFAHLAMRDITPKMVRDWLRTSLQPNLKLSSVRPVLSLLTSTLERAVEEERIVTNPARGVRAKRVRRDETHEPWTYLYPPEQKALLEAVPGADRWMIGFLLATGLRKSEAWNLELIDVHETDPQPHIIVRWGTEGGPTKSRKIRRVDLVGFALMCLGHWLKALPTYAKKNEHGLLFPSVRGNRRVEAPDLWPRWVEAAGIKRRLRIHDLRHTCASSLIAGWWGHAWRIEEVQVFLGHATISQTQRYAHLSPSGLIGTASETRGVIMPGLGKAPPDSGSAPPLPPTPAAPPALPPPATAAGMVAGTLAPRVPQAGPTAVVNAMEQAQSDATLRKPCSSRISTFPAEIMGSGPTLWATRGLAETTRGALAAIVGRRASADDLRTLAALALTSPSVRLAQAVLDADDEHLTTAFALWAESVESDLKAQQTQAEGDAETSALVAGRRGASR